MGKSTLLRTLYRSYRPRAGHIWYHTTEGRIDLAVAADVDIALLRRREIGFVTQFLIARPRVAAEDIVAEPLRRASIPAAQAVDEARRWLAEFGVKRDLWRAYPTTMILAFPARLGSVLAFMFPPHIWSEWSEFSEILNGLAESLSMAFMGAVLGGVTARHLKWRFAPDQATVLQAIAWWDWDHARLKSALHDIRTLNIDAFIEKNRRTLPPCRTFKGRCKVTLWPRIALAPNCSGPCHWCGRWRTVLPAETSAAMDAGGVFATMTAAVAGAPVSAPARIRPAVVAVIGVLLGSRFTPDVLGQVGIWSGSVAILMVYVVTVALVVVPFYRFAGRFDWVTAYFAGMPGGLSEMIEIGEASGAKPAPIILAHSLRIVVTIALIAFWFRIVEGQDVGASILLSEMPLTWVDATLMLACAILGSVLGKRLHFPAPTFLGPLLLSAVLHLTGATDSVPPSLLVNAAQVILGELINNRLVPNAMEPRALIGEYQPGTGDYKLTTTSQNPHLTRLLIAAFVLGIPENKLTVMASEVGGGFGSKIYHYGEEVLVLAAAKRLKRPVRWTAERSDSFLTDAHGRDHVTGIEFAC